MAEQNEMKQILEILTGVQGSISGMQQDIHDLKTDVADLKTDVADLKTDVADLKTDVADLRDTVEFMKGEMMTKEDGRQMESRMLTHIDGLAKRSETFDHELIALRSRGERHEDRIEKNELHVGMA